MTKLKNSTRTSSAPFPAGLAGMLEVDRRYSTNNSETAEYSRFKVQLKRAVDSVEAPEYLIDAIKIAIRR